MRLNAAVLDLWSAILRELPTSRLLVYRNSLTGESREDLRRQFAERGVGDDRLELRHKPAAGQTHWSVYHEIDLSLDTFPWSGHTTACESLWMGVPVATLRGNRYAGRMVASVLTGLQLTEWIADTSEQYLCWRSRKRKTSANCGRCAFLARADASRARSVTASALRAGWKALIERCGHLVRTNQRLVSIATFNFRWIGSIVYSPNPRYDSCKHLVLGTAGRIAHVDDRRSTERAVQFHNSGNLDGAEHLYRQILQVQPSHLDALHLLGVIMSQKGHHQLGVQYIGSALAQQPYNPTLLVNQAIAYHALGRLEESFANYRQVIQLQPSVPDGHYHLSTTLLEMGRREEAEASCREALRLRPNDGQAYCHLGNILNALKRVEESVAAYRQALLLQPTLADAHNNLGNALEALGRPDEAAACFQQTIQLRPSDAQAFNNLGRVQASQGKLPEAIANYQAALRCQPNFPHAYNNLGNALSAIGRHADAVACFRNALQLQPDYANAYNNLGAALVAQAKSDEAIACYTNAITLKPNFAVAHNNLASAGGSRQGG